MRQVVRTTARRNPQPSAAILDSQSVKTAEKVATRLRCGKEDKMAEKRADFGEYFKLGTGSSRPRSVSSRSRWRQVGLEAARGKALISCASFSWRSLTSGCTGAGAVAVSRFIQRRCASTVNLIVKENFDTTQTTRLAFPVPAPTML